MDNPDYQSLKDIFTEQWKESDHGQDSAFKYDWVVRKQRILNQKREEEQELAEMERLNQNKKKAKDKVAAKLLSSRIERQKELNIKAA